MRATDTEVEDRPGIGEGGRALRARGAERRGGRSVAGTSTVAPDWEDRALTRKAARQKAIRQRRRARVGKKA